MPRIRSIHPDACDSEKLATLSDSAERTFFRLLTHTDDEGRGEDRPKLLAAKIYPLNDDKNADTIDRDLDELKTVGLVVRYVVEGKGYYCIPTFRDWQNPRHPTASKLPSPDDAHPEPDAPPTGVRGISTADRRKAPAGVGVGEGGGEGVGAVTPSSTDVDPEEEDDRFDEFWHAYPARNGKKLHKAKALQQWQTRVPADQRDAAITGATHYALAYTSGTPGVGAMDAFRWLRDRCWPDWQEPATPPPRRGKQHGPAALPDRDTDWTAGWGGKVANA